MCPSKHVDSLSGTFVSETIIYIPMNDTCKDLVAAFALLCSLPGNIFILRGAWKLAVVQHKILETISTIMGSGEGL